MARYKVGLETQGKILEATRRLLSEVGFEAITVKAICAQAGIQAAVRAGCQVFALVPDPSTADLSVPKGVTVLRSLEDLEL